MPSGDYLVWIDLEMTGLKPATDAIIEIATVVTDRDLNVIADGPVLAIHQPEEVLARMDDWNRRQHGSSGLLARVRASRTRVGEAQQRTLGFLAPLVTARSSRMSGYLHLIVPRARFRLLRGADALSEYTFNTGTARHLFCRRCGVKSFYVPRSNPEGYSVNVRCLDQSTLEHIDIEPAKGPAFAG